MKKRNSTWSGTAILIILLSLFVSMQLVACSGGAGDGTSTDFRSDIFLAKLKLNGFNVNEGSADPIYPFDLVDNGVMDSACGNNASQPYKKVRVPLLPAEEQNQIETNIGIFRLNPYEAIVYVGPTPPLGDYFSFTPFLWVRHADSKVQKGDFVFAALGDPLNNTRIKTEGGGNPFKKNTMIIFTSDRGVYERVAQEAIAAGYPESMINLYVLPSELLHMGIHPGAQVDDSFLILVRSANIYDARESGDYMGNDHYARIFRVTPDPVPNLDPYATPEQRNRKATAETDLIPGLEQSLDNLKNAILAKFGNLQSQSFESIRWWPESRDVLKTTDPSSPIFHLFVAGEASDTPYRRTSENGVAANFKLGKSDMVIVYGVNHAATGLATYSNLSVYNEKVLNPCATDDLSYFFGCDNPLWNGVVGMGSKDSQDPIHGTNHFTGSAEYFIPGDPNAKYLYAVRVLRQEPTDSENLPYVVVPEPKSEDLPATGIGLDDPMIIGYRAYVNPATGLGPAYEDVIPDRAILFTGQ